MASLASSASISPLAKSRAFAGKSRGAEKQGRFRALVVRASKDESESRWVDPPTSPPSMLSAESAKHSNWGRKAKVALAGAAMIGASLVMPRPALAVSEYVLNGGYATAGAAAASLILRATRGTSASIPAAGSADLLLAPMSAPAATAQKAAPEKKLSKLELAGLLLAEIPAWQRGVFLAVPAAALVGLVAATKKWVHVESLRIAQLEDHSSEKSELAEKLAELEAELAAVTRVSASFEDKLEAANADLKIASSDLEAVNASLVVSNQEVEEAGRALLAVKADAEAQVEKLGEQEANARAETRRRAEQTKAELEAQLAATADLRRQLGLAREEALEAKSAMKAADASRDAAAVGAAKVRLALERELLDVKARLRAAATAEAAAVEALRKQEDWRRSREAWEEETKAAFLALEQELKVAVAKLEAAETEGEGGREVRSALERELAEVTTRAETAETEMRAASAAAAAARLEVNAEKDEREAAAAALDTVRAELEAIRRSMESESAEARSAEEALAGAMADAQRLRAEMDSLRAEQTATAAALKDARLAMEASMLESAESTADAEKIRGLKATHDAQMWEMECTIRALEETMVKAHSMARQNAERMMRHNKSMGRVVQSKVKGDADIPVTFEIVVQTEPGQRVAMVGTWNDWNVEDAFPMRWTEGNLWTVTTPIHADDTYEYKYVIIDDNNPKPFETAVWQYGNNRTLALQLRLHDEVVLVEVVDSWVPNPKSMPIMLHHLDGTVAEVGSTELLRDCVRELRVEQALLDGSEYVRVLEEISTMTLGAGQTTPALIAASSSSSSDVVADPVDVELMETALELPDAASPLEGDVTVMAKADGTTTVLPEVGAAAAAAAAAKKETGRMGAR